MNYRKLAKKLRCQFCQLSTEKLNKLLKSAHIYDQELNAEIDS